MNIEYRETFLFYESYGKTFERLRQINKDKADQYIYALIRYGLYGELPEEDSDVWLFGFDGVILALAVSGLRCAITLPCYFLLAIPAWSNAVALARFSFGREHRTNVIYGHDWWKRLLCCMVVLVAGICLELLISPYFLQVALDNIFT